jgi:hypothetical protein
MARSDIGGATSPENAPYCVQDALNSYVQTYCDILQSYLFLRKATTAGCSRPLAACSSVSNFADASGVALADIAK